MGVLVRSSVSLPEQLPFWEFSDSPFGHVMLHDGSVAAGLELLPLDIECFDENRLNQLTMSLRAFVNSLPEDFSCQFFVKVENDLEKILSKHQSLTTTQNDFLLELDQARLEKIKNEISDGELFRPRLFLFLKTNEMQKPSWFSFKRLFSFSAEAESGVEDRLQSLGQSLMSAKSNLASGGLISTELKEAELQNLIYKHFNPVRSKYIECPAIHKNAEGFEDQSPREQIVFGDVILDKEDFVIDSMKTRILTLKTMPEMTHAGMMSRLLTLPFQYELLFSFNIDQQSKEMAKLQQSRRTAHALSSSNSNKVSDLESESKLTQTTSLIREIIETGQRIFKAELVVILRSENTSAGLKILNQQTKEVLSQFRNLSGSEGLQETVGSWKIFKSNLPLAPMNLVRGKKMKTNNMVDFLPLYGASIGDDVPVCLTKTRQGTLYSINPYSARLNNYNALVTGASGSGKSFANNFLMLQQIARGVKVFIVDIGGSYKKMTELLDGQYFEINLSGNYRINPFELKNPSEPPSSDRLKGLVSIIEQMVTDQGERLSRFDRVSVESVLVEVYAWARSLIVPMSPTLSDFQRFCAKSPEEGLQKIAKLLFPWVGNTPYGRLLDGIGRIESDRPIVAFDLKGLSQYPDLQSVMILILTNFILEQVESDKTVSKRILMDEVWELLKSPAASQFMEYAARTFRKTGSGISFITQGVEEIIASGMGPAILNNTATKLVMLQKSDAKVLQDSLKLNSQELRLIQSLEQVKGVYSEGFLMEGETRQIIRIQPSPLVYWISTSDSKDNQYLEKLKLEYGSLKKAVLLASRTAPYGVAQGIDESLDELKASA